MSRFRARAPILPVLLLSLGGCIATQRDVIEIEQQADEIKTQILELKKTISSLQANQADLAVKMDQMHGDVNAFREAAKDSSDSMARLSTKIDELESALGRKVSGMAAELTKQQNEIAAKLAAQEAAAETARKGTEKTVAATSSASQIYHAAESSLHRKNYAAATAGFKEYLQKFPKGEVADLATYFLGEAYYGQRGWKNAAKQYATVLDRHPKSDITPAARLKYAMCLMNLKTHSAEAKRYLQSIPDDFPQSPEASAAKKLLKKFPETSNPQ